ncbi:hypothetical protein I5M27_08620 [Adhaeribacter sp. BT258]|uniref:Uncharacterized protein n=1 Tax=Adhaeribacter terrigena TaxID=2793070 RepID=A0ABS1C138_9BACT|nr:hypothetical protein [Adhaeribacter terrigena]MBK0403049.1 hypothetical protein [Adhaeribacter terrigena]
MINIIILSVLYFQSIFQSESINGCWLPEEYVFAATQKHSNNIEQYLKPIEGFDISNKGFLILTYKGEVSPIKVKQITDCNNRKIYKLLNFKYYINQKYNSKALVDKYEKSNLLILKDGEKLLLEIHFEGHVKKVYFVDKYKNYEFKNIRESKEALKNLN